MKNRFLISLFLLSFVTSAEASPTSADFARCKKLAVAILESCLKANNEGCWDESRSGFDSCNQKVMRHYARDPERRRAAIEREREMRSRQQQVE